MPTTTQIDLQTIEYMLAGKINIALIFPFFIGVDAKFALTAFYQIIVLKVDCYTLSSAKCQNLVIYIIIYITRMRRVSIVLLTILLTFLCIVLGKVPNPYKVLGVPQSATDDEIKNAFKRRSKKYHPDRNKEDPRAREKFEKVVNAYELLKDPERKRRYDLTGDDNPQEQQFHHGGGFGFSGINIEDLMRQGFFGGYPGGHPGGHPNQQDQRRKTYTFSFGGGGGGNGMRFQF